jgi:hypothetical protein
MDIQRANVFDHVLYTYQPLEYLQKTIIPMIEKKVLKTLKFMASKTSKKRATNAKIP